MNFIDIRFRPLPLVGDDGLIIRKVVKKTFMGGFPPLFSYFIIIIFPTFYIKSSGFFCAHERERRKRKD